MINKRISILSIIFILGSTPLANASPLNNINFIASDFTSGISFFDSRSNRPQKLLVKKSDPLSEAKDPARRRGTENWENPQGNFFVVPAVVLGIIGIALFFNRD
jgi:hypothetical protein